MMTQKSGIQRQLTSGDLQNNALVPPQAATDMFPHTPVLKLESDLQ